MSLFDFKTGVVGHECVEAQRLGPNVVVSRIVGSPANHGLIMRNSTVSSCVVSSLLGLNVVSMCVHRKDTSPSSPSTVLSPGTTTVIGRLHASSHSGIALDSDIERHMSANIRCVFGGAGSGRLARTAGRVTSSLVRTVGRGSTVTISVDSLGADSRCAFGRDISITAVSVVLTGRVGLPSGRVRSVNMSNLLRSVNGAVVPGRVLGGPNELASSRFGVVGGRSICNCGVLGSQGSLGGSVLVNILRRRRHVSKAKCPLNFSTPGVYRFTGVLSITSICSTLIAGHPCGSTLSRHSTIRVLVSVAGRLSVNIVHTFVDDVVLCPISSVMRLDGNRGTEIMGGDRCCVLQPAIINISSNEMCGLNGSLGYTDVVVL